MGRADVRYWVQNRHRHVLGLESNNRVAAFSLFRMTMASDNIKAKADHAQKTRHRAKDRSTSVEAVSKTEGGEAPAGSTVKLQRLFRLDSRSPREVRRGQRRSFSNYFPTLAQSSMKYLLTIAASILAFSVAALNGLAIKPLAPASLAASTFSTRG